MSLPALRNSNDETTNSRHDEREGKSGNQTDVLFAPTLVECGDECLEDKEARQDADEERGAEQQDRDAREHAKIGLPPRPALTHGRRLGPEARSTRFDVDGLEAVREGALPNGKSLDEKEGPEGGGDGVDGREGREEEPGDDAHDREGCGVLRVERKVLEVECDGRAELVGEAGQPLLPMVQNSYRPPHVPEDEIGLILFDLDPDGPVLPEPAPDPKVVHLLVMKREDGLHPGHSIGIRESLLCNS